MGASDAPVGWPDVGDDERGEDEEVQFGLGRGLSEILDLRPGGSGVPYTTRHPGRGVEALFGEEPEPERGPARAEDPAPPTRHPVPPALFDEFVESLLAALTTVVGLDVCAYVHPGALQVRLHVHRPVPGSIRRERFDILCQALRSSIDEPRQRQRFLAAGFHCSALRPAAGPGFFVLGRRADHLGLDECGELADWCDGLGRLLDAVNLGVSAARVDELPHLDLWDDDESVGARARAGGRRAEVQADSVARAAAGAVIEVVDSEAILCFAGEAAGLDGLVGIALVETADGTLHLGGAVLDERPGRAAAVAACRALTHA